MFGWEVAWPLNQGGLKSRSRTAPGRQEAKVVATEEIRFHSEGVQRCEPVLTWFSHQFPGRLRPGTPGTAAVGELGTATKGTDVSSDKAEVPPPSYSQLLRTDMKAVQQRRLVGKELTRPKGGAGGQLCGSPGPPGR